MERRLVDERRRLRLAPADGRAQDRQHLVQRGDLDPARVLGFRLEPVDERRLFERLDLEVAEVLLQNLDSSGCRVETSNTRRSQVTFEVGVQEPCDAVEIRRRLFAGRLNPRIASGLDLADAPIDLLAYYQMHPTARAEYELLGLDDYVRVNLASSSFSRVWVFDADNRKLLYRS